MSRRRGRADLDPGGLLPRVRASAGEPEPVALLIAAARRSIKQAVLRHAAPLRLSPQQFWLVVALREHPGLSQAELAARLRADAPTVSRVVASLARRRAVRTEPDPADRRRARLFLTAAGERLAATVTPAAREVRAAAVVGLGAAELDRLRAGLRRVIANMERLESCPPAALGLSRNRP